MGGNSMGGNSRKILSSLLGMHFNEEPPELKSLVPQRISNEIMIGNLPKFNPSTIMLNKSETCHFMNQAALAVQMKEKLYKTRRIGSSYRLSKNHTIHSGGGTTKPIEQSWYEYKKGVIFVTNERIIFVAPENGFEKKIRNLTAVIPYTDALALQFGNQTLNVIMPDPQLMIMVLKILNRS